MSNPTDYRIGQKVVHWVMSFLIQARAAHLGALATLRTYSRRPSIITFYAR